MGLGSILAIYFLFFAASTFFLLPFGVRTSQEAGEEKLREAVRLAVRRCATLWTGKKPVVDVQLLKVG